LLVFEEDSRYRETRESTFVAVNGAGAVATEIEYFR